MEMKLIDTGYYNINKTGTQASASDRAGYDGSSSVTTFDIQNITSIKLGSKQNNTIDPDLDTDRQHEVEVGSSENNQFNISFIMPKDTSGSFNNNYFSELNRLTLTKTVKCIYPSGTGEFNSILNLFASRYNGGSFCDGTIVPTSTNYIPVYISSINFTDKPKQQYIGIKIQLVVAG